MNKNTNKDNNSVLKMREAVKRTIKQLELEGHNLLNKDIAYSVQKILKSTGDIPIISNEEIERYEKKVLKERLYLNLPHIEITHARKCLSYFKKLHGKDHNYAQKTDFQLGLAICAWRINKENRVCTYCLKWNSKKIGICTRCNLTWYCNKHCQKKDWKRHKQWCCKPTCKFTAHPMIGFT